MHAFSSDETGLVKVTNLQTGELIRRLGRQEDGRGIQLLRWGGAAHDWSLARGAVQAAKERELCVALKNGSVECWDAATGDITARTQSHPTDGVEIKGLDVLYGAGDDKRRALFTTADGRTFVSPLLGPGAMASEEEAASARVLRIGDRIERMRLEPRYGKTFALGGRENLLRIYDLETSQQVFKARNVPDDFLDLRVPVWLKELQYYMPEQNDASCSNARILTGTANHQLRLYDIKAQERPLFDLKIANHAIISMVVSPDGNYVYIGEGSGRLQKFDMRMRKTAGLLRGAAGSVRSVDVHPSEPVVVSASLDRYLRAYNADTRERTQNVYLKQRLTGVLVSSQPRVEQDEDDVEDVWEALEGKKGTKRQRNDSDDSDADSLAGSDDDDDSLAGSDEDEEDDDEDDDEDDAMDADGDFDMAAAPIDEDSSDDEDESSDDAPEPPAPRRRKKRKT